MNPPDARSLALHDDAVTRYSLAVTDVELGRLVEARDGFRAYLTQTEHSPRGREYRDAATRALAAMEPRVPSLAIDVTPSDVEPSILVDGAPAGRCLLSDGRCGPLPAGNLGTLELRASGAGALDSLTIA